MQPGPINTLIALTLYEDTPDNRRKVRTLLSAYGFRNDVDNHVKWPIELPDNTWLGARIDRVDALRGLILAKLREDAVDVRSIIVAKIGEWAMQGWCDW